MSETFNVKLNGMDMLLSNMRALSVDISKKAGRAALRKAANVIGDAARENARKFDDPKTPESIAKNVTVKFSPRRFKNTGDLMFRIGVRGGAKNYAGTKENVRKGRAGKQYATGGDKSNPGGDTWYWRFIEFGTKAKGSSAARRNRGRNIKAKRGHAATAARPFLRNAVNRSKQEAVDTFQRELAKIVSNAGKKQRGPK